ncbi:MAG: DivIVA domain-containing protein [Bacteroidota bacterium]
MITPLEIRQQQFKRVLRGYDRDEVHAFLNALSQEWEKLLENQRNLKEEMERIRASYETLKEVEGMLHKTLMQAEKSSKDTLENARQKAELKMREAEAQARDLIREASDERKHLQQEVDELTRRRNQVLMQLQLFLKTQLEKLGSFELNELPVSSEPEVRQITPPSSENFFESGSNGQMDDLLDEI